MSRFALSLAMIMTIVSGFSITEPQADACGVKLALKKIRQHKGGKQVPVNTAADRPTVATRQARTPIAAGPHEITPRRIVEAKPVEPDAKEPAAAPVPPPEPKHAEVVKTTVPEKVAVQPVAEKPQITTTTSKPETPVVHSVSKTTATLDDEVFFTTGSAAINPKDARLDKAVRWLTANPVHVVVEGYADPTGSPDANMALSQSRAEAVRDFLVSAGIDTSTIEVVGYGDTKLKYGRSDGRNRRVAIEATK